MVYGYAKYKISKISDPSGKRKGTDCPIWFLGGTFGNGLDPLLYALFYVFLVLFWFF